MLFSIVTGVWNVSFQKTLLRLFSLRHFGGSSSGNSTPTVARLSNRYTNWELFINLQFFMDISPFTFFCMVTYITPLWIPWKVTLYRITLASMKCFWSDLPVTCNENLIASPIPRVSLPPSKRVSLINSDWLLGAQVSTSRQGTIVIRTPTLLFRSRQRCKDTFISETLGDRFGGPLAAKAYP